MAVFKCKMCGGSLEVSGHASTITCDYCGSQQTLPRFGDRNIEALYERADNLRRNNEFDKAMALYEQILNENPDDAESYWSIVLCEYGIVYVEDPMSGKRMPTVNRMQPTSIYDDVNYISAIKYADSFQRSLYEEEAEQINEIQKGILEISRKEEPFDVFICYKETDESGERTRDSVYATELYHELTREGFKVFFARITLEDKLGVEYEPYIFAALHSAKVMVVLGTKPEYFNAVWVRNEWSRYLSFIKKGERKMLIPAYRDMDAYDLPKEFSNLQAQNMDKLGFMPDLVRGIKKIVEAENEAESERTHHEQKHHKSSESSETVGETVDKIIDGVKDAVTSDKVKKFFVSIINFGANIVDKIIEKLNPDADKSKSKKRRELERDRNGNLFWGVVWLILFWPISIYFFVKALLLQRDIFSLK